MLQAIETMVETPVEDPRSFVRPARVLETDGGDLCRVQIKQEGKTQEAWAMLALPGDYQPKVDDRVLVTSDGPDGCYVVGLLGAPRRRGREDASPRSRLDGPQGTCATLARRNGEDAIEVRDRDNRVIFEYRPGSGKAYITMPGGDLAFDAPDGAIELNSANGIVVQSAGALQVSAPHGDIKLGEARYEGRRFEATLECAKVVADRMETMARRIVEKAKNVYRMVESLNQVKAGRMRTLVDAEYQLNAGRAALKSDDDMRIDGERIYLG